MIAVDVETTGTEPHVHSIFSVGAVDLKNPSRPFFYEECRPWDGAKVEPESTEFLGLTLEQINEPQKQTEADLVRKFITWAFEAKDRTFAGQNVSFDRDFLRHATMRAGHTDWPFAYRSIDTHTLAYMHMTKHGIVPPFDEEKHRSALNLDAVLNYCGIPEEPTPHNALTGAKSHAEVIARLLYDKMLLSEFEVYPIPWKIDATS